MACKLLKIANDPVFTAKLLFVASLLVAAPLMAVDPHTKVTDLTHTKWSGGDLPFSSVADLVQAKDGAVWLTSGNGLFRFDGVRFTRLDALSGTSIRRLLATSDGGLWVVFLSGRVSRLFEGKVTTFSLQELPQTNALAEGPDGSLIAATANGGLARFRSGRWKEIAHALHHSAKRSQYVWFDRDGVLWLVTEDRVLKLPPGAGRFLDTKLHEPPAYHTHLFFAQSPDGTIWFANGNSVRSLSPGGPVYRMRADVTTVMVDREGTLWIGTFGGGLWRVPNPEGAAGEALPKPENFTEKDGLSGNHVSYATEDREGNIWVSTAGGIDQFRQGIFHRVAFPNAASIDEIWDSSNDGGILIHTSSPQEMTHLAPDGEIRSLRVPSGTTSNCYEADGTVWLGTPEGIGKWTGKEILYSIHMRNASIIRMGCGHGDLWVASLAHGVTRFSAGKMTPVPGLRANVNNFNSPGSGQVWVTYGDGTAFFYDHGVLRRYGKNEGVPEGEVHPVNAGGGFWLVAEGGLARFKKDHFERVDLRPDFPLAAAKHSANGFFWMRSGGMLLRMATSEFDRAVANPGYRPHLERYGPLDGIPGAIHIMAGARDRLWLLTAEGLGYLDQDLRIHKNTVPPPVEIETLTADGKTEAASQGIALPKLTHNLQIDYTAYSLSIPERVRFRYKLEGADKNWQETTRRQAYYTDLAPKKYRFLVKASNNDGVWNEAGSALDFSVDPAYYQTHWFEALCLAAGLAMSWGLYRLRLLQVARQFNVRLEERIAERTRIARELHDTLLQSFQGSLFEFQAARNLLSRRLEEARSVMDEAITSAESAIAEGRDAIQDLRSGVAFGGDLAYLFRAIGQECSQSQRLSGGNAQFRVTVEGAPQALSPVLHDEIYGIGREILRNAFRHARARRIEVEIRYDSQELRLRIRDDGIGIDPKVLDAGARPGHWGLAGVRERAKLVGAKLDLWSQAATGTEVEVTVPASIAYAKARTFRGLRLVRRTTGSNGD